MRLAKPTSNIHSMETADVASKSAHMTASAATRLCIRGK